jgi:hypothetical protein
MILKSARRLAAGTALTALLGMTLGMQTAEPPGACRNPDGVTWATADGGCKDLASGRVWGKSAMGSNGGTGLNWYQAQDYCSNLTDGGFNDWRTPTLAELHAAAQHGGAQQIQVNIAQNGGFQDSFKWSTTRDKTKKNVYLVQMTDDSELLTAISFKFMGQMHYSSHDVVCVR